jgi:hypothetical protein
MMEVTLSFPLVLTSADVDRPLDRQNLVFFRSTRCESVAGGVLHNPKLVWRSIYRCVHTIARVVVGLASLDLVIY